MDDIVRDEESILQRLLDADDVPTRTVTLKRLGIEVKLRALTGKQVFALRERCTIRKRDRRGQMTETMDEEQFNALAIVEATVNPNWGHPQLLAKYKASGPEEVVKRILLAGELSALAEHVLDLSGFNEDVEEIKN